MKDERGFALVITLIITALLVALTAEFVDEVYVDTTLGHNYVAGQQASILASSGVDGGIKLLQVNLSQQSYSSLLDRWAQPLKIDDDQGSLLVTIEEESGKLNLNAVTGPNGVFSDTYYPIAVRLLKELELSPDLGDALADWVGTNEGPHPAGAKSSYYNNLNPPYGAKNARLETLEELALVKGFTSKVIEKLSPFVTVYPDQPNAPTAPININTAPQELVAALAEDMTDDLTARVLEYRKTTPFKDKSDIVKVAGMQTIGQRLQTITTAKGAVYRIRSVASVKETSRTVEAVVRIVGSAPKAYTILYWREY